MPDLPMLIHIVLDVDPDHADPRDDSGLTESAHLEVSVALASYGEVVSIEKSEDQSIEAR